MLFHIGRPVLLKPIGIVRLGQRSTQEARCFDNGNTGMVESFFYGGFKFINVCEALTQLDGLLWGDCSIDSRLDFRDRVLLALSQRVQYQRPRRDGRGCTG